MTLRRLSGADAAAWQKLRLDALRDTPNAFLTTLEEAEGRSLASVAAQIDSALTFGMFDAADLVGMLTLVPQTAASAAHRASVVAVYVAPAHRRAGAAAHLLHAAEAEARSRGIVQLELSVEASNAAAVRFYTRHGFRQTGVIPRAVLRDGGFHDDLAMVRDLDG